MNKSRIPTKTNLEKHPKAVVIWEVSAQNPDGDFAIEFDWFDKDDQMTRYMDEVVGFMQEQVAEQDAKSRTYFLVAAISDTKQMQLLEIRVVHTEATQEAARYCEQWAERVSNAPLTLVQGEEDSSGGTPIGRSKNVATKKVAPKEQPKRTVKGRRANAVAADVAPATPKTTTARRGTKPRAKQAAEAVEAAPVPDKAAAVKEAITAKGATPTAKQDETLGKIAQELVSMGA